MSEQNNPFNPDLGCLRMGPLGVVTDLARALRLEKSLAPLKHYCPVPSFGDNVGSAGLPARFLGRTVS
jgi:hypothetical protein